MNDACHIDFCQMSERMLAKLGFKLTTPGLTAHIATNRDTSARRHILHKISACSQWVKNLKTLCVPYLRGCSKLVCYILQCLSLNPFPHIE